MQVQAQPEPEPPECAECAELTAEFARLRHLYGASVERLFEFGYRVADTEWAKLKAAVDKARQNSEVAEFKLEIHKRDHARGKLPRPSRGSAAKKQLTQW